MQHRARMGAVAFAVAFPTVVTFVYFVALANQSAALQNGAYSVGKVIQFGFPVAWVAWRCRERLAVRRDGLSRGLVAGLAFGLVIAGAMLGLYYGWLRHSEFFTGPAEEIRRKVTGMSIDSVAKYAALGLFYSVGHSFLEEYYWRWFVFGELRSGTATTKKSAHAHDDVSPLAPFGIAVAISCLGFMAHHVLVLATFFGWYSPATYLFSAGVAVGGAVWAWLYERSGSLLGPWLSHLLVDAAIFLIGYDVVRTVVSP